MISHTKYFRFLFYFLTIMGIFNKANAFIFLNPDADYAAGGCVYQPESKEAIFNSLEKHTLWEDFLQKLYITHVTLSHYRYAEKLCVIVLDN